MSKYRYTDWERWAVFETHGGRDTTRCWLCYEPLDFKNMVVDHVLPERLLEDNNKKLLADTKAQFGLDGSFNLNSFDNWLPAHGSCNNKKHEHVFRATPLIQVWLDQARGRAAVAAKSAEETKSDRQVGRAIMTLAKGTSIPVAELHALAQRYATQNTSSTTTQEIVSPVGQDKIGMVTFKSVTRYVAPDYVTLAPDVTIVFSQVPTANSEGPFFFEVKTG